MYAGAGTARASRPAMLRGARMVALGIAAAVLAVGLGLVVHRLAGGSRSKPAQQIVHERHGMLGAASWAPGVRPAPAIAGLPDQHGRLFSLAALHGHTVAIVFFDSHCHQECPLEGHALAAAERPLPRAERPILVAVSVNPQDTPASAAAAIQAWGLSRLAPWYWLMGSHRMLARAWRAYHIYVGPKVNGDIAHTEAVILVDKHGYERSAYLYPFMPRFVTHDLRQLAAPKE
ncbi:MAG TPA: SCO family protein [Solirubrobacteraceae bacterium]|nr:SCO family protein [Solirubrobacteraceae bacterium]